jgi:hypothetical protein
MNVRGINQRPKCEPATSSSVDSRVTGSTGIQKLTFCRPSHKAAGGFGQSGFEYKTAIVRIVLPIAEIFDEAAWVIRGAGDDGARTQGPKIQVDTRPQRGDLVATKELPNAHCAVALILLGQRRVNHAGSALSISSINAAPRYAKPV